MESTIFITTIEVIGTLAFAISGVRLSAAKRFDWFGAYMIGLVTATGGGTLRDVCLKLHPFWMCDWLYVAVTGVALVVVIAFRKHLVKLNTTFFLFDTIGLALFVVVGIQKTLEAGFPFWVAVMMGTITGSMGSVMRDVFINIEPLLLRKDFYAMACVIGGIVYFIVLELGGSEILQQSLCACTVVVIRLLAQKFHLSLPTLKSVYKDDDILD